jgi:FlaG/FlaF family flagellin (archaellin)
MRKLTNHKKAVSPVIASVLMILVTMVGMTILFAFVSSYSENYKAGIGSSVMESLSVEDIWLLNSTSVTYNNTAIISVYNVGKVDSIIKSIYVNGLALSVSYGSNNFHRDTALEIGNRVSIRGYWAQNWVSGQIYTFKISTQSGSTFNVDYKAP